jgi:homoserine O-succinyltransferase
VPSGYFDKDTESKLTNYQKRAIAERTIPLSVELPKLVLRHDLATGEAALAIFRNWLEYLSEGVKPAAAATHPR